MTVADDRRRALVGWYRVLAHALPGPVAAAAARPRPRGALPGQPLAGQPTTRWRGPTRSSVAVTSSWRVGLFLDDHAWEAQARGDFQARIFELEAVDAP